LFICIIITHNHGWSLGHHGGSPRLVTSPIFAFSIIQVDLYHQLFNTGHFSAFRLGLIAQFFIFPSLHVIWLYHIFIQYLMPSLGIFINTRIGQTISFIGLPIIISSYFFINGTRLLSFIFSPLMSELITFFNQL